MPRLNIEVHGYSAVVTLAETGANQLVLRRLAVSAGAQLSEFISIAPAGVKTFILSSSFLELYTVQSSTGLTDSCN